jgi:hypothetical protein
LSYARERMRGREARRPAPDDQDWLGHGVAAIFLKPGPEVIMRRGS